MVRRIAMLVLAAASLTCSSTPPVATCTVDADCTAGRCLDKTCFKKNCENVTCALGQVCQSDLCVDELCVSMSCNAGSVCLMGNCLPTKCMTRTCGLNQVCDNDTCLDVCAGVLCAAGQTCQGGNCVAPLCGTGAACSDPLVCDGNVCVEAACVGVRCDGGVCSHGSCVDAACVGITCDGGTCSNGHCTDAACVGVVCDGGTCSNGHCTDAACVGVVCDGGTCENGACVDPQCIGVHCDGGVCSHGACVSACDLSCAAPCPTCPNGRTCGGPLECDSRDCPSSSGVCTACDNAANACPNGGVCMNGTCKAGLKGPCLATVDCEPAMGLVCDLNTCRLSMGGMCTGDDQCISSLRCVNLTCQRPKCTMQNIGSDVVPGNIFQHGSMAAGLSATGELFVTHGQWSQYDNYAIRRFRVSPGAVQEQDPKPPSTLLTVDGNDPIAHGHSDTEGGAATNNAAHSFSWYPAGGTFDGLRAVQIQFVGFNNDIMVNFFNGGRYAKCGDDFIFLANALSTSKAMLRFHTPNPVGSGTVQQTLTTSDARYDNWTYPAVADIGCSPAFIYVLGSEQGMLKLAKLDRALAPTGSAVIITGATASNGVGDYDLAVVDDTLQFIVNGSGNVWQVHNGVISKLSNITYPTLSYLHATQDQLIVYNAGTGANATITRFARRLMDGTTPPLDLDCQWQ